MPDRNPNHWNPIEWSMALDGLDAQGVDMPALLASWGLTGNDRNEVVTSRGAANMPPVLRGAVARYGVTLSPARHSWVLGVLAGEIEPRPIPE